MPQTEAQNKANAKWKAKNKDKVNELARKRYHKDPDKFKKSHNKWKDKPGNKEKAAEKAAEWFVNNPERTKEIRREAWHRNKDRWRQEEKFRINRLLVTTRSRAKRKGIEHTITVDDISIPEYCPILGVKIEWTPEGKAGPNNPSIDRIDPTKGYTPDNICVVSVRANTIKNDGTLEEHRKIVEFLEKIQEQDK